MRSLCLRTGCWWERRWIRTCSRTQPSRAPCGSARWPPWLTTASRWSPTASEVSIFFLSRGHSRDMGVAVDEKNEEFMQRPPSGKKVISISEARETHVFSLVVKRTISTFSLVKLRLIFLQKICPSVKFFNGHRCEILEVDAQSNCAIVNIFQELQMFFYFLLIFSTIIIFYFWDFVWQVGRCKKLASSSLL